MKVTIFQHRLLHYRVALFEELRMACSACGIDLNLVHGQPSLQERLRQDTGRIPWAIEVNNVYVSLFGTDILFQPVPCEILNSDIFIIMQENKIITNYVLLLFCKITGRKIAYWGHGANFQSVAPRGLRESWKRFWLRKVDWWFAYTDVTSQLLKQSGFPAERITCLNNAIDVSHLTATYSKCETQEVEDCKKLHRINDSPNVAVFCGSLYPDKKLDLLVDACILIRKSIPDFQLVVIGNGPSLSWLQERSKDLACMRLVGVQTGKEKAKIYRLSRVILNPGLLGLHILDSFATGLPIVSTLNAKHSPEIAYIENGVNGILTDDTPDAFAQAVIRLLSDSEYYLNISRQAKDSASLYSLGAMVQNFVTGIKSFNDSMKL